MDVSSTQLVEVEEIYELLLRTSETILKVKDQIEKGFSGTIAASRHQRLSMNESELPKFCACALTL